MKYKEGPSTEVDVLIEAPIAIGLGTDDLVRDRLRRYRDAGITTLRANLHTDPTGDDLNRLLDDLGRLLDLVRSVNDEPTVSLRA